jgi:putative transposase
MGRPQKYFVTLSSEDRKALEDIVNKGKHLARDIKRAKSLLLLDEGKSDKEVSDIVDYDPKTISRIRKSFVINGITDTISDKSRDGRPSKLDGEAEAVLTAIACSDPPEGYARWTLRLLADKAVELELVDSISHVSIGKTLKKTN